MARGRARLGLVAIVWLAVGCVSIDRSPVEVQATPLGYTDDRERVEVITTNIGGKNVFVPSTLVLTAGSGRSLSFFNTTDTPHGLMIPALGIEMVLQPGEETLVPLPELEAGRVHEIRCHIHPPHRGASLVVVPAR